MRLAYGYAQYGYTQRRDFLGAMNTSAAAADAVAPGHPAVQAIMDARLPRNAGPAENAVERAHAAQVSARLLWPRPGFQLSALLFLQPARSWRLRGAVHVHPPLGSALTACFRAHVPTAENLDSARSNVNNFALLGPRYIGT